MLTDLHTKMEISEFIEALAIAAEMRVSNGAGRRTASPLPRTGSTATVKATEDALASPPTTVTAEGVEVLMVGVEEEAVPVTFVEDDIGIVSPSAPVGSESVYEGVAKGARARTQTVALSSQPEFEAELARVLAKVVRLATAEADVSRSVSKATLEAFEAAHGSTGTPKSTAIFSPASAGARKFKGGGLGIVS